ncbi:MAG: hypothetical protein ACPIOQ_71940, partial [Promethearchaeia archaeon]
PAYKDIKRETYEAEEVPRPPRPSKNGGAGAGGDAEKAAAAALHEHDAKEEPFGAARQALHQGAPPMGQKRLLAAVVKARREEAAAEEQEKRETLAIRDTERRVLAKEASQAGSIISALQREQAQIRDRLERDLDAAAARIVAPRPQDRRQQPAQESPTSKGAKGQQALAPSAPSKTDNEDVLSWRQGLSAQGSTAPMWSLAGSSAASAGSPTACSKPMPTLLHGEMHAMLCGTLQLADAACSAVWATVPVLQGDTVGIALRRQEASAAETPPPRFHQVIFDVEAVRPGSTKAGNMGSMAASRTDQGVGSAWEHHGMEIVHSSPEGLGWAARWLHIGVPDMRAVVVDCEGRELGALTLHGTRHTAAPDAE